MKHYIRQLSYCLLVLALITNHPASGAPAPAGDSKKATEVEQTDDSKGPQTSADSKKPASPKPAIHTVKKGPFKIEAELDGIFEAQNTTELVLRPEAWAIFKVLKVVEHGSRVKRGDLLVALELEKIDLAIGDLRREHEAADVAIKLAEQQFAALEQTVPMDLAAAERSRRQIKEDTDFYFKVGRAMAIKSVNRMLESAQFRLEYAEEELRQLEKMYQADDLTEETEEIILKRARRAVDSARFYLEREKIDHQQTLKVTIPRRDVGTKESARRSDLQLAGAKLGLPLALKKARLDLAKLKLDRSRSDEKLKKLLADRGAMTVKAPVAGVVYHGRFVRGKLSGGSPTSAGLREGAALPANQVFMTIVRPRPMLIRATVAEKQLQNVRAGIKGTAVPTGYADLKLTAIVSRVAAIPISSGAFDARITIALDPQADALMPGMTCKVKLVAYLKKDALTVPPKAVSTDELDHQKHYVYVLGKRGKSKKRPVMVGKRTDKKLEILGGLSAGEKILAEPPKEKP